MTQKTLLWIECALVFLGLPLLIYIARERAFMITVLWIGAAAAYRQLVVAQPSFSYVKEWNSANIKLFLKPVIRRFLLSALLLTVFTLWVEPERFLSFPRERPFVWLMVMLLYPLLSVWPQEILYRTYFMTRYQPIFLQKYAMLMASAVCFSYAHILFNNWIALVFTLIGGLFFADTYQRSRSLALVCLEHALYGCFVFTIGLGWYFYGTAWQK